MLSTEKTKVTYCSTLYDQNADKQAECEFELPEYCPDLMKIVRADASLWVDSVEAAADKMNVTGKVCVNILYMTQENDNIVSVSHTMPFENSTGITGIDEECAMFANVQKKYINCRMISPRKVAIKCTYILSARTEKNKEVEVVSGGDELEILSKPLEYCTYIAHDSRTIKIEDDIAVASDRNEIANLLYCTGRVKLEEQKAINNKIIAKGIVCVEAIYTNTDGGIDTVQAEIPFNHIFEVDGTNEESVCLCNMYLKQLVSEVYEDSSGENRIIAVEADIGCEAHAFECKMTNVCEDAFSTNDVTNLSYETLDAWGNPRVINGTATAQGKIDFDDDIMRIYSITGESIVTSATPCEQGMNVKGNIAMSVLCMSENNKVRNIDADMPFECLCECDMENMDCVSAQAQFDNITYTITSANSIDVKANVFCECCVRGAKQTQVISDIEANEGEAPRKKNNYVVIYYPSEHESFWNIAKRYNVSCEAVKRLNGGDGDTCESSLILIPRT